MNQNEENLQEFGFFPQGMILDYAPTELHIESYMAMMDKSKNYGNKLQVRNEFEIVIVLDSQMKFDHISKCNQDKLKASILQALQELQD